jgi:hypothetical protein
VACFWTLGKVEDFWVRTRFGKHNDAVIVNNAKLLLPDILIIMTIPTGCPTKGIINILRRKKLHSLDLLGVLLRHTIIFCFECTGVQNPQSILKAKHNCWNLENHCTGTGDVDRCMLLCHKYKIFSTVSLYCVGLLESHLWLIIFNHIRDVYISHCSLIEACNNLYFLINWGVCQGVCAIAHHSHEDPHSVFNMKIGPFIQFLAIMIAAKT